MVESEYLTTREFAELVGISRDYVSLLIRQCKIKAFKFGGNGHWRIKRDEIERLTEGKIQPEPVFAIFDSDYDPKKIYARHLKRQGIES